jgi:hypothetical protein
MVRLTTVLLKKSLGLTDERAKLEGELLAGMEVVKCNAWEVRRSAPARPSSLPRLFPATINTAYKTAASKAGPALESAVSKAGPAFEAADLYAVL